MAKAGLTAKYRPQLFKDVVGQDFIKKILSRAAQQDKPANAYLFSGTRGVGKTTTARIMAKAINCLNGPDFEPCNDCTNCRQITKGIFSDVLEIDAASHTGVDNVRKLREDAVYFPMSGKYKVIIIDEAHMLSNAAFNALLKTLEEPPGHCIFIMATTAPEKFPPTVISRCQHYVFKMVPLDDLVGHLKYVLDAEKFEYDPEALTLMAKRGAGSVRDSMSILAQVMALGGEKLTPQAVREVLGLAGHDVYADFFEDILNKDLVNIHTRINSILGQGLDINFFLQEFASCWRNLFLLSQSGDKADKILLLPANELEFWKDLAEKIPAPRIHAAWQMVIEEQKSILKSNEPALAMELLFFNLAYLPELLPIGQYTPSHNEVSSTQPAKPAEPAEKKSPEFIQDSLDSSKSKSGHKPQETEPSPELPEKDWPGFINYCRSHEGAGDSFARMLGSCDSIIEQGILKIICNQEFIYDSLKKNGRERFISGLVEEFFGSDMKVKIINNGQKHDSSFREKALDHPVVKRLVDEFDSRIIEIKRI